MRTVTARPAAKRPSRRPPPSRGRRHGRRRVGAALSLCVPLAVAAAAEAPGAAFDLDRDGRIGNEEFRQFLVERIRLPLSTLDDDGDGRVSSAELRELAVLLDSVEDGVEEYRALYPDGLDIGSFVDYAGIEPPPPPAPLGWLERSGLLVRGKLESVGPFGDARAFASASAATLSFSRDLDDDRAWSALKGVVLRPIRFESRPDFVVTPSVSINRVSYLREDEPSVDTLALRMSLDRLYHLGGTGAVESIGLRANPTVITDSGLETRIVSAELQAQPTLGVGAVLALDVFDLRWQPTLFAEYGHVIAGAGGRAFDDEKRFGRLGPGLDVEVALRALEGIEAALSWQYLVTGVGGQRDRKRVELSLTLSLDRSGHFSIQVLYANGDASAKLEDEEHWSLGLGVKY